MSDPTVSMEEIASAFGARVEVGIQLRAETPLLELMKHRARTKQQIRTCVNCGLRDQCKSPVPMEAPRGTGVKILAIGEAPGKREDELGRPFVGPAGKMLKGLLSNAGFDPWEMAFCNTISCYPNREPPTPNMKEMIACRGNLRDQVVSSGATYVLLVGGVATSAWRSDMKVSEVHGQLFIWGGIWLVMPIYHPAAILRDVTKKDPTIDDLKRFREIVEGDLGTAGLGVKCVRCGGKVDHYDPDGVPYCDRHWLRYGNQWKVEMKRWSNEKVMVKRRKGKSAVALIEGQQTILGADR